MKNNRHSTVNHVGKMALFCECDKKLSYNERFDAYFCNKCDQWKESKCTDKECLFCTRRPEKPSEKMNENNSR